VDEITKVDGENRQLRVSINVRWSFDQSTQFLAKRSGVTIPDVFVDCAGGRGWSGIYAGIRILKQGRLTACDFPSTKRTCPISMKQCFLFARGEEGGLHVQSR